MNDKFRTLTLQSPVEYGDNIVTELKLRRPLGKHFRRFSLNDMENMDMDTMMNLVGDLSGQPPKLIDQLEMEDLFAAMEMVGSFFDNIKTLSTKPSAS